ncbi:MAG: AI-2E family transporter [Acidimicrobiales bacterium]|jgi:predicted PurR-regulated permease PerM
MDNDGSREVAVVAVVDEAAAEKLDEAAADVLVLPIATPTDAGNPLGVMGRPFDRRAPFFVGLTGALGVAVAYVIAVGIGDIASVLVLIGLALFIAIGLNPIVAMLVRRGLSRGAAVAIVTFGFLVVIVGFVLAAVAPISHEVQNLVTDYPRYRADLATGKGWSGQLVKKLHLTSYFTGKSQLKLSVAGGVLGVGKTVLTLGVATISVIVMTLYFLIALPGVKRLWLLVIPLSRRERVGLLTNEVFDRVGGFMLGNLLTSLVAGVGSFVWLAAFGVPYALLLALFVALFDLIPMIGSTIAGLVVTAVALSKGFPVGAATGIFYVVYRFAEDYLLNPRVMKHTVKVSPGLTIIATLIGGTLLGLIGALVAIPMAATAQLLLEEVAFPRQNLR